jgi:hypothetical protein
MKNNNNMDNLYRGKTVNRLYICMPSNFSPCANQLNITKESWIRLSKRCIINYFVEFFILSRFYSLKSRSVAHPGTGRQHVENGACSLYQSAFFKMILNLSESLSCTTLNCLVWDLQNSWKH